MTLSLLAILLLTAALFTGIVCIITIQLIRMLLGEAPFISTQSEILCNVVDTIPLKKGIAFYELGCGDARVLIECHKREPSAKYIGIEKNIIPYCLARWNLFRYGHPEAITLWKKDLFSVRYTDADIIYAYLFPEVLDTLLPKLKRDLRPGALVISPSFRFSEKKPDRTVTLSPTKKSGILIQEISFSLF